MSAPLGQSEVGITKPRCLVKFSNRLLLFQSYRQLLYAVVIFLFVNLVIDYILPFHSIISYLGAALFSFISILLYLWQLFPHEMIIFDTRFVQHPDQVEIIIQKIFREVSRSPTTILYRENVPAALSWPEARVELTKLSHAVKIIGPQVTLSWLRKRLLEISSTHQL